MQNEFITAIIFHDYEKIKQLISQGLNVNKKIKNYQSALIASITGGDIKIVELMLDNGGDLSLKFKKGYSPLHYAVECSDYEMIKLLIERGGNVNQKDNHGNTPLWYACANYDRSENITNIIELLLSKGADANSLNVYNLTPVSWHQYRSGLENIFKKYIDF